MAKYKRNQKQSQRPKQSQRHNNERFNFNSYNINSYKASKNMGDASSTSIMRRADFHVHIKDNSDGVYSFSQALEVAILNNVANIALLQHNDLHAWTNFVKEHNLPKHKAYHKINGVKVVPAVEITCRDSENENYKGNPLKLHMVVLAPILTTNSPIVRLLKIKSANDRLVDYGLLNYIAEIRGITIDHDTIKKYVINKRNEVAGFNTFGTKDSVEFFKRNGITVAKSQRELENMLEKAPRVQRLNLDMKDIIDVAHASGALVIFAHPPVNLVRTATPEKTVENFLKCGGDGFEIITSSMDEENFKVIMDTIKANGSKNSIIFTGGSDTHVAGADVTIGKTAKGEINEQSQIGAIYEIEKLESARARGLITERNYGASVDKGHIESIIKKYADMEAEYEKVYDESKQKAILNATSQKNQNIVVNSNDIINPLDFKSFEEYMSSCFEEENDFEEDSDDNIYNLDNENGD